MLEIQANWLVDSNLLRKCKDKSHDTIRELPENYHTLFDFRVNLGTLDSECTLCSLIDVRLADSGTLQIVQPTLPNHSRSSTSSKRRKTKPFTATKPALADLEMDFDIATCLILVQHARKISIPLVHVKGCYLEIKHNNAYLEFGLAVNKNAGPFSTGPLSHRGTGDAIYRIMGRLIENPHFADPFGTSASSERLYEILARPRKIALPKDLNVEGLKTPLLKFQKESLRWCMRREGVDFNMETGNLQQMDKTERDRESAAPLGWHYIPQGDFYVNPYTLWTSETPPEPNPTFQGGEFCGKGLLAEEMGLGKTLEILALSLLHTRPETGSKMGIDPETGNEVVKVKATLVICPDAIVRQWKNEITSHSPQLQVFVYRGKIPQKPLKEVNAYDAFVNADYVICSYSVIAQELHSAKFNPSQRNTRFGNLREDIDELRSPFVKIQFWRVILDEVQMVHTGSSQAAQVARLIPRVHAWGVTGTPVKASMSDLKGILLFLDVEPYVDANSWARMLATPYDFETTMYNIGIRHTKAMVSDQLHLPPQHRRLITIPFTEMERHRYDSLYEAFTNSGASENQMAGWLVKLRQACCYTSFAFPGESNNMVDAHHMTVEQVSRKIASDAKVALTQKTRNLLVSRIEMAQVYDRLMMKNEALDLFNDVVKQIEQILKETEEAIEREDLSAMKCTKTVKSSNDALAKLKADLSEVVLDQSKFTSTENKENVVKLRAAENEASIAKLNQKLCQTYLKSLKTHHRLCQELLHRAYFLLGQTYFRHTEHFKPDEDRVKYNSEMEALFFGKAEELRAELLSEPESRVHDLMKKLKTGSISRIKDPRIKQEKDLNNMAVFMEELLETLHGSLLTPLLSSDQPQDGENDAYTASIEAQNKERAIIHVLECLYSDREHALTSKSTLKTEPPFYAQDQGGWEEYHANLLKRRNKTKPSENSVTYHKFVNALPSSNDKSPLEECQRQNQELVTWKKIIVSHKTLYAARNVYYNRLQTLSDHLVDPVIPEGESADVIIERKKASERNAELEVTEQKSKLNFVKQLETKQPSGDEENSAPSDGCVICQESFSQGSITVCGHEFCTPCIMRWMASNNHCPLCRAPLSGNEVFNLRTTVDTPEIKDLSSRIYKQISSALYNEIRGFPLTKSFSSKIDMVIRHVLHIKSKEPEAQIVIFSQWAPMLRILKTTLNHNGVATITLDDGAIEFQTNTEISCILLHAKSDAAGLTLINATHVILCEPLLNTSLELQAISRIHRIGQTRETTVWLLSVQGTVEQAILQMTTEQRVRQIANAGRGSQAESVADSAILAQTTGKLVDGSSGSEIVGVSELYRILFSPGTRQEGVDCES